MEDPTTQTENTTPSPNNKIQTFHSTNANSFTITSPSHISNPYRKQLIIAKVIISEQQEKLLKFKFKYQTIEKEYQIVLNELISLKKEFTLLNEKLNNPTPNDLTLKISQLENDNTNLLSQIETLNNKLKEKENLKDIKLNINQINKTLTRIQNENDDLVLENKDLKLQIQKQRKQILSLQEHNKENYNSYNDNKHKQQHDEQVNTLLQIIKQKDIQIQQLENELQCYLNNNSSYNNSSNIHTDDNIYLQEFSALNKEIQLLEQQKQLINIKDNNDQLQIITLKVNILKDKLNKLKLNKQL